jgi:hypothetical protein
VACQTISLMSATSCDPQWICGGSQAIPDWPMALGCPMDMRTVATCTPGSQLGWPLPI